MKGIFQSDLFKDYTKKMLAHLDEQIQNDPNTAKTDLLLPGIIQHVSLIKEAQTNMHCNLKEDIQQITRDKDDVVIQKIETAVKQSVNSTLEKLGQCMATLEVENRMEIVECMEEIEVESASCDEQSNTTI